MQTRVAERRADGLDTQQLVSRGSVSRKEKAIRMTSAADRPRERPETGRSLQVERQVLVLAIERPHVSGNGPRKLSVTQNAADAPTAAQR